MSTKIILLFSLALDETYAVFKMSFVTGPNALGKHMGPDIFHFVVFFLKEDSLIVQVLQENKKTKVKEEAKNCVI